MGTTSSAAAARGSFRWPQEFKKVLDRRAGGGRTASPARTGTATSSAPGATRARTRSRTRWRSAKPGVIDRHHRPGLRLLAATASPPTRPLCKNTGRAGRARGVRADDRHRFHRADPEDHRRAQGQAGPKIRLRDLGRRAAGRSRSSWPIGLGQVRHHADDRQQRPRRCSRPMKAGHARGHGRRRLLLLRDPEESGERLAGRASIRSASTSRRTSSPRAASPRRWPRSPRIQKAGGTDTEKLISAMEGMEFDTPKGR